MPLSDGRVSRWVASSNCRGAASSEAEFPLSRGPVEGSAEAELACSPRVSPLPSSEVEMHRTAGGLERGGDHSTGWRGPRMGRTVELSREPSVDWDAVGEL